MSDRGSTESLSAADASNVILDAVDQVNVFLMAGILGPGGFVAADGESDLDRLRGVVAGRLADPSLVGLQRFSQRIGGTPRRPLWESCAPDLAWHVRRVTPVQGRDGLAAVCATLMTTPLPSRRPLWELLIVPGAIDGGTGIILRIHHAVADGVAGVRLVQQLFDPATVPGPRSGHSPQARPLQPLQGRWRQVVTGASRVAAMFSVRLKPTVLLGTIGPRRGIAFGDVGLTGFADGARTAGGTVNDALLAAVAAATSATLLAVGERIPAELPASVPVALPDRGTSGNAVGIMVVPLPLAEADVAARIARIAATTTAAKAEARSQGTYELTRSRWGTRVFAFLAKRQRFIALFVTNVRGPVQQLTLAGAPLERAWPVTPIQGNVRLGVSAMTYAGRLNCVAHVDADALDVNVLGGALREDLDRICALAPSGGRAVAPPARQVSLQLQRNGPPNTL